MRKRTIFLLAALILVSGAAGLRLMFPSLLSPLRVKLAGARTVSQVMKALEPKYHQALVDKFRKAGCGFTRSHITFIALKRENRLEAWCRGDDKKWRLVDEYRVLAASGRAGPKLKEGDRQVPEGLYTIPVMNPNSRFHLSMKVNYPNDFDKTKARADGRTNLGGDIFIHGSFVSIGCLAMGDGPIEELFYMTQRTGRSKVRVIIMPYDFRKYKPVRPPGSPGWTSELYKKIHDRVKNFTKAGA